ncbi:uncharacterized protein LOC113871837 [Abrus precatorius]|uniref:Uncharacterized protein LOC113871837 n=1 Tax=Abrus precatorius TaxID=3816 RepID=A0A8B8MC97_ABRPR|nr:uncharacterized protein LOC113871837 [Abrus precatorius]
MTVGFKFKAVSLKQTKFATATAARKKKKESREKEEAMRTVILQSKSRSNSLEEDNRDNGCYFPGCKKNANCNCEICLASINATLDLMPNSIHKTSLTKLSAPKPNVECTPISFDASMLSTPGSSDFHLSPPTPIIKSTARSDSCQKMKIQKGQESSFYGIKLLRLILGLGLLLSVDLVFPWAVSGVFQPSLSPEVVKRVAEKCSQVHDLNAKLRLLQKELASVVGKVSNCSFEETSWQISQDGLLLNSRCTLYKSAIEEVTIWGWPLQTAGLLTNGFSFRTYSILSGRVTQWNGGQVGYLIRKANTSWVQPKWGASVVQLDPNTWVLEYQSSSNFYNTRLYSALLEFFKYWITRIIGRVKKDFWVFAAFEDSHCMGFTASSGFKTPT